MARFATVPLDRGMGDNSDRLAGSDDILAIFFHTAGNLSDEDRMVLGSKPPAANQVIYGKTA